MTVRIPKNNVDAALAAIITEMNRNRDGDVSTNPHACVSRAADNVTALAVTAANASSLATSRVLANQLRAVCNAHFADMGAHKSVQTTAVALAEVPDLADDVAELALVVALANQIKSRYESNHRALANVHFTNDATNTIAAADATDQTSANTLLNELKTDINAHILLGLAGDHIELTDA